MMSSQVIPHAEVWTPPRPMLSNTLPIPPTDTRKLRQLLFTGKRRQETSAMRKLWKSNRSSSGHGSEVVPLQGSRSQVRSQTASSSQWEAKMMTPAGMGPRSYSLPIQEPELMRIKTPPIAKDSPELVNCEQPVEAVGAKSQSAVIAGAERGVSVCSARTGAQSVHPRFEGVQLPRIRITTLSADWWHEIKKRNPPRMEYTEPVTVTTDRNKIKRQIAGKFFCKNSSQTYFYNTIPRHQENYVIHPEFDSEVQRCWGSPANDKKTRSVVSKSTFKDTLATRSKRTYSAVRSTPSPFSVACHGRPITVPA